MTELIQIQEKWQKRWAEAKIFEATPDDRPKFFLTLPYPYINAYPHIGHLYTYMRGEAFARYKRHKGFNVLYPQAWHATGSPILNAAKRVKEKEEKQIKIMKDMGFSDKEIKEFEEPKHWVDFFAPEFKKDFSMMGLSIDWRREFITTSLNPRYDAFIKWQFNKLKEKEYVIKGKFPVIWCEKDNCAVGDHTRSEGEGESVQEFTLMKFKMGDEYVVVATLRPETVYGQTNMWVGAEIEYVKADVNGETWIISKECVEKLKNQEKKVKIKSTIMGSELLGKYAVAPGIDREVIILPSYFCNPAIGTGIVTSVPADAPDDWIGLRDLKENEEECKKFGLDYQTILDIHPIPIINTDMGETIAVTLINDMKIKSQHEKEKLLEAKKIAYKKGFYEGVMNSNCGEYSGMKVQIAKDMVKQKLLDEGKADLLFEMTGKVVCRCLTPSIVKIVDDQWFIDYGNMKWKEATHKCLDNMKLYPDKARVQFDYVIDWLHKWACTREEGLGTKLPWDDKWLIESLSDSTIYMSYYTLLPYINGIDPTKLDDKFFDYVLLGEGDTGDIDVPQDKLDEMRTEFNYWYPMDFRNSGKDLIQNHLTFFMFNHTAIFPEDKWPKGIGVNGWVTVDGQKMSKSLGNMIPMREMANKFSADASRITILSGGESLDDPNWETEFAKSMVGKLTSMVEFAKENYNKGRDDMQPIDEWAVSRLNLINKEATEFMEETLFRSAIQKIFFELRKVTAWYQKRTMGNPNKDVMNQLIESSIIMLAPFTPHQCEEAWEVIGREPFVSTALWPEVVDDSIDKALHVKEDVIKDTMDDIQSVFKLAKIEKPKSITLFVSKQWKYELYELLHDKIKETRNPGELLKFVMGTELKQYGKDISKILPKIVKSGLRTTLLTKTEEKDAIASALDFFKDTYGCKITVQDADESDNPKANNAMPGKTAILVE